MFLLNRFPASKASLPSSGPFLVLRCGCMLLLFWFAAGTRAQEPAHPSLLFEKNDIEKLREDIKSGWMKDAFQFMQSRANEYMEVSADPYPISRAKSLGRGLNNQVSTLALTGIVTGDRRYCDHAVDMVVSAAKQTDVNYFVGLNHHLSVGDGAHAYSMAYDWLWEYMSEDERELLRNEIRSFGKWLYDESMTGRGYGDGKPQNLSCDHNSVMHGGLGLCSLVLHENPEWMERAKKFVHGYLEYSIDETGYSYAGVSCFKEIQAKYQSDSGRFVAVIAAADTINGLPRVRSILQSGDIWLEVASPGNRRNIIQVTPSRIIIKQSER